MTPRNLGPMPHTTPTGAGRPGVSVVIPTCNRNETLARCLEALEEGRQCLPAAEYEVIVTDDSSHGSAMAMIRDRFPWATWIQGPRRGPAANRNNGAERARAAWLVFTDDDCVPDSGWLRCYLTAIASEQASVYEGRTYTEPNTKGPFWGAPTNESGGLLWSCNMAIRRDVFRSIGGFDALFPYPHMEDVDFRERIKAAGHPFVFVREAGVFHPLRPVGPIVRQALGHESYFYYARKHGLSLRQAGLSPLDFIRARVAWIRASRNPSHTLRFLGRSAVETVLVGGLSLYWTFRNRSKRTRPS